MPVPEAKRRAMHIDIIDARPDHPSDEVSEFIWSTDPELMRYVYGDRDNWRRVFAGHWANERGPLCWAVSKLAVRGTDILGLLISMPAEDFEARWNQMGNRRGADEDPALRVRLARARETIGPLFPEPRPGSYYIFELAVAPRARGLGLGRHLLEEATERARATGCRRICLDVAARNEAVAFYRRLGMTVAIETRIPELAENHDLGTHFHMVLPV